MASEPIGGTAAPVTLPGTIPHMPAVARILARHDRDRLEAFLTVAIDLLDVLDGDPEAEETGLEDSFMEHPADGPGCPIADGSGDQAWIEWTTMRGAAKRGPNILAGHEDDEDADPAEEDDPSGQCDEDGMNTRGAAVNYALGVAGPGCDIADPGGCEHNGLEREQMLDDVPAPHVFSLEHNLFTDKRVHLAEPGPGGSVYFQIDGRTWRGTPL